MENKKRKKRSWILRFEDGEFRLHRYTYACVIVHFAGKSAYLRADGQGRYVIDNTVADPLSPLPSQAQSDLTGYINTINEHQPARVDFDDVFPDTWTYEGVKGADWEKRGGRIKPYKGGRIAHFPRLGIQPSTREFLDLFAREGNKRREDEQYPPISSITDWVELAVALARVIMLHTPAFESAVVARGVFQAGDADDMGEFEKFEKWVQRYQIALIARLLMEESVFSNNDKYSVEWFECQLERDPAMIGRLGQNVPITLDDWIAWASKQSG